MEQLKQLILAKATGPSEMIMALTMLAYGVPMMLPPAEFPTYPAYAQMGRIATELTWGSILVGIGLCRVFVAWCGSMRLRRALTLISVMLASSLCVLLLLAQPSSPGTWVFGTWVIIESWTLFRLRLSD